MKTLFTMSFAIIIALVSTVAVAQGDIISASDFMALYKSDKNLKIIDASKADSYSKVHIRNAINIPSGDLNQSDAEVEGLLKPMNELAEIFGKSGISESDNIVVYDGGSQKYSSRVYWALKYAGAKNVKILHKDMEQFKKARVPLTPMPTKTKPAIFNASPDASIFATTDFVKSGKAIIVDARTDDEFSGVADNSEGHLPGAVHLNYVDVLDENNAFLPKDKLEKVVADHGLNDAQPIAIYCRTSVRATVIYTALVNQLGYKNVKVYDGAYLEWVDQGNPVNTGLNVTTSKKQSSGGGGC